MREEVEQDSTTWIVFVVVVVFLWLIIELTYLSLVIYFLRYRQNSSKTQVSNHKGLSDQWSISQEAIENLN